MFLTHRNILDIVEIFCFAPVIPVAFLLVSKTGGRKASPWAYLLVLGILRIVGSATGLASSAADAAPALVQTSIICYSIGLTPLLLSTLGLLKGANNSLGRPVMPSILFRLLDAPIIAALVLAVLGGLKLMGNGSSTTERQTGQNFIKYASIIFGVMTATIGTLTFVLLTHARRGMHPIQQKLITLALYAWPFLALKVAYNLINAVLKSNKAFSSTSNDVIPIIVQVVMALAPEALVTSLYLVGGFQALKAQAEFKQEVEK